jgi:electron transport complex protein RnfB
MLRNPSNALADRIDAVLPQTQCRRCGESGCRPYAESVARGAAPINRCPPGGDAAIVAMASLLGVEVLPLDIRRGVPTALAFARIDESTCIGCTLCIRACPTDAIVGAAGYMHTVVADRCTGCELCLPPCPVDCIVMVPASRTWDAADAARARQQFDAHNARLRSVARRDAMDVRATLGREERKRAVASAFARARARRAETAGR